MVAAAASVVEAVRQRTLADDARMRTSVHSSSDDTAATPNHGTEFNSTNSTLRIDISHSIMSGDKAFAPVGPVTQSPSRKTTSSASDNARRGMMQLQQVGVPQQNRVSTSDAISVSLIQAGFIDQPPSINASTSVRGLGVGPIGVVGANGTNSVRFLDQNRLEESGIFSNVLDAPDSVAISEQFAEDPALTSHLYPWFKKLFMAPDAGFDALDDPLSQVRTKSVLDY